MAFDPTQLLSLNCFFLGDKPNESSTVKIPETENISILKDLIKERKAHDLDLVDASKLNLFKVSLFVDDDLEKLKNVDLVSLKLLLSSIPSLNRIACTSSFKHHLKVSLLSAVHQRCKQSY